MQGHTQDVKAICWIPGTRALVSASYDNTIKVWNEVSDEWVCTQTLDSAYQGHEDTVWGLCCDPMGTKILSCDASGMILLWQVAREGEERAGAAGAAAMAARLELVSRNQSPGRAAIYSIDWSTSGLIALGAADNSLSLLRLEPAAPSSDNFDDDEEKKRKGESEGDSEGERKDILTLVRNVKEAHGGDVNCVRFNPKKPHLLATGGDDEVVRLWNLHSLL